MSHKDSSVKSDLSGKFSQMKRGVLEYAILLAISQKPVYASDIIRVLQHANLIVVEGTLYPLLSRLKNSGWLKYTWVESEAGPPRKYYSLTKEGSAVLKDMHKAWDEIMHSLQTLNASNKGGK